MGASTHTLKLGFIGVTWASTQACVLPTPLCALTHFPRLIFKEHLPTLSALLKDQPDNPLGTLMVLEDTYRFSR